MNKYGGGILDLGYYTVSLTMYKVLVVKYYPYSLELLSKGK